MKQILTILIILCSINAFSQGDNLLKSIAQYEDTTGIMIQKGRKMLLNKFLDKDFNDVKAIKNYLKTIMDKNKDYVSLYPFDLWLIDYWLSDYNEIITTTKDWDSIYYESLRNKIHPPYDMLYRKLLDSSKICSKTLMLKIDSSQLDNEKKEFLKLHLKYCLIDNDNFSQPLQDTLNILSNEYFKDYSQSDNAKFVRKYISYQYEPRKWSATFEFFSGYGFYTGELKECFKQNIPIGVAFDFAYKKDVVFYLRDYIGFTSTQKDINFKGKTWKKGESVNVFLPEFSVGYNVFNNRFIKIAPFAGIASHDISPPTGKENDEKYKDIGLTFTTNYTFGVNLDFKIKSFKYPQNSNSGIETGYPFIRVRYGYNLPQFSKYYDGFNGQFHYITIGFGVWSRGVKRKY